MRQDWSDAELAASVDAYREMARKDLAGERYTKKQVYLDLAKRFGRSDKSFEFRMQNISAVLDELGLPWIAGLKPKSNVGSGVKPRLVSLLSDGRAQTATRRRGEPASYKEKLAPIRDWLIRIARAHQVVNYSDVMVAFDIDRFSLRHAMDRLGHQARDNGEPVLTALIVGKKSKRCSVGIKSEFGIEDDNAERQQLYAYWDSRQDAEQDQSVDGEGASLSLKAARFASTAVRPEQAAFRRKVFTAWAGRCAVSGCDLRQALDAAHRHGRHWKMGHNTASDGLLLRKDLHGLYDAGLLTIDDAGMVQLQACARPSYPDLHEQTVRSTRTWKGR